MLGLTIPTGYSSDGSAANRAAAGRDAGSLLTEVRLPAGAARLSAEPVGDQGFLKPSNALESDAANAIASQWWQLPGTPWQAMAFVRSHPPAGAKAAGSNVIYQAGAIALSLYFQWPPVPGVLGGRTLAVTATTLPGGATGVLLESQSDWVVLRPSSERIPSTVRRLELTSTALGQPPIRLRVTRPDQVTAVVRIINSLPIGQPAGYFCPAQHDPRLIKVSFQTRSGTPLALLYYMDFRPWLSPSIACKTIGLTIAGRPQDPLLGGNFLPVLQALLGRPLV